MANVNNLFPGNNALSILSPSSLPTKRDRYLLCYEAIVKRQAFHLRNRINLKDRIAYFILGAILGGSAGFSLGIPFGSLGAVIISVHLAAASALLFSTRGPLFVNERFPSKTLKEELDAISNEELIKRFAKDPLAAHLFTQLAPDQYAIKRPFWQAEQKILQILRDDLLELKKELPKKMSGWMHALLCRLSSRFANLLRGALLEIEKAHDSGKLNDEQMSELREKVLLFGIDVDNKDFLDRFLAGELYETELERTRVRTIFNRVLEQIHSNPGGRVQRLLAALFLEKVKSGDHLKAFERIRGSHFLELIEFMLDNHPVVDFILDVARQGDKGELVGECFDDRLERVDLLLLNNKVIARDIRRKMRSLILSSKLKEEMKVILFFSDNQALGNVQDISSILNSSSL